MECNNCKYYCFGANVTTIIETTDGKTTQQHKVEAKCKLNIRLRQDGKGCPHYTKKKEEYLECDGCKFSRAYENDDEYTSYNCLKLQSPWQNSNRCRLWTYKEHCEDCETCDWYLEGGITDGLCRFWDRLIHYNQDGCFMHCNIKE